MRGFGGDAPGPLVGSGMSAFRHRGSPVDAAVRRLAVVLRQIAGGHGQRGKQQRATRCGEVDMSCEGCWVDTTKRRGSTRGLTLKHGLDHAPYPTTARQAAHQLGMRQSGARPAGKDRRRPASRPVAIQRRRRNLIRRRMTNPQRGFVSVLIQSVRFWTLSGSATGTTVIGRHDWWSSEDDPPRWCPMTTRCRTSSSLRSSF